MMITAKARIPLREMQALRVLILLVSIQLAWGFQTQPIASLQQQQVAFDDSTVTPLAAQDTTSKEETVSFPVKEMIAEAFGTFLIVQIGTASVMSSVFTSQLSLGQVANAWSLAVTIAILLTAPQSGAHLNPAVTLSLALWRKFPRNLVVPYMVAQLGGAVVASAVNMGLYGNAIQAFEASQSIVRGSGQAVASACAFGQYFSPPVSILQAFSVEVVGTALLVATIFGLRDDKLKAPLIGCTVGALIRIFGPLTQAGFNPARDLGPRIVAFLAGWKQVAFQSAWLYLVAPFFGAILGGWFVDKVLHSEESSVA